VSKGWQQTTLSKACVIRPKKNEVKAALGGTDLVSFVSMDKLGVRSQRLDATETRPLDKVYSGYTYFAEGDVLLAKITPCFQNGKLGIATDLMNGVGFGSSEFFVFRCLESIKPEFLFYLLSQESITEAGAACMSGAVGHQRVPLEFIEGLPVPLPPLPEQERIVAILDEAFAAIATATANAEKNLANARELFESQLEQAFTPDGEEGWTESTIKRLVDDGILSKPLDGNHGEIHPKKADFVDSGVPFIMAADLIRGSVDQENCTFISHEQADSLRKGFARDGDVLLSHKGTIGRTAVLNTELEYVMLTPQVTYYRIDDPAVLFNRFLYYSIQTPRFLDALWKVAKQGSTRAYIGITKQLELLVAYPSLEEQVRIVKRLDRLTKARSSLVRTFTAKKEKLANLKQSLLHKAFTGELTADSKAADRSLSEAGV